jgi:hypothetical protein
LVSLGRIYGNSDPPEYDRAKDHILKGIKIFEKGIKDQRRFFVNVRKCGFADVLLDHGARDLLYTLCATDYTWGDGLGKYNIRFERPTTISEGSDACRFQFFKNADFLL